MKNNDRKEQIVKTAAQLFREKGYNAVSMRDLAKDLGIKAASLYNHISSKEAILAEVILSTARDFTEHIDNTFLEEKSSVKKLEEIIESHIDLTIEKANFVACLNNDWMHLEEKNLNDYIKMRNHYESTLRKIIIKGMNLHEIEPQNPELILFSLLSTLRTLYLWYPKNKHIEKSVLSKELKNNLLKGIITI
ncbi:TetR/AcrR family transcriptional regulator [Mesonia sp. K7]|uniref:TetR/AcrR family transcriptional regulator n=1 Tax=Mesonia sp. K7 TaxID=2218606 RepID=UPI000DAA2052|nr:TetR/AcrR family transcriptional regulator [Mesonia sp. K7]PZD78684.1 TetR/AcrR family transcriptional regulator [Mesonia sp. K7]